MIIDNPKTSELLCEWANNVAFLCDGLDSFLQYCGGRNKSLPAPLTLEACERLTDEEMQEMYKDFNLIYYPDIPKNVRSWYLWQSTTLYRYWGTPKALEVLSQYIMGENKINLIVHDNLAFNDSGELINENALDTVSIELLPNNPELSEYALSRILENLYHYVRNQEFVEGFTFTFEEEFELPVHFGFAPEAVAVIEVVNDENSSSPAIPFKAFTRSSAYQDSNKTITANSTNYLYDEGMNATLDVITGASYILTGAYTSAGVNVDITGCYLDATVSDGKLRLVWGNAASAVCYITYSIII